jgi:pyruvate kinase
MAGTKIVATIGPSSLKTDVLEKMYRYGLSCIRINTAHIEAGYIAKVKETIELLNMKTGMHVGVMVDLKGPELRTGTFPGGHMIVKAGQKLRLSIGGSEGDITLSHPEIAKGLEPKETLLLSDGRVRMRVLSKDSSAIQLESLDAGDLRDRSRVNIPGKFLPLGTLTERDMQFLQEGVTAGVEFFAQSFVQRKEDVMTLQKEVSERGGDQLIVSKIETKSGYVNIKEISRVSDFVMVARGDLGVELPLKEVAMAQKHIIEESHKHGVPAIVATQMLESMVKSSSPTRAEVSDVTNAILDNTDAVMLSEESAVGDYPDLAVRYLNEIAEFVESRSSNYAEPREFLGNHVAYSIARASKIVASEIEASAIVTFSKTGTTPKMISAVRPGIPIISAVPLRGLANKLSLYSGVVPLLIENSSNDLSDFENIMSAVEKKTGLKKGERVVVTSGAPYFLFGGTNDVRVATIGKFMGRGYPSGKNFKGTVTSKLDRSGDIYVTKNLRGTRISDLADFTGIIFLESIGHASEEELSETGIPFIHNTKLLKGLDDGINVYVDGSTGVITS